MAERPAPDPAAARWEVWWQDDNGNEYLVSRHLSRAEAQARVAEFEAGPRHKQIYWVRERR